PSGTPTSTTSASRPARTCGDRLVNRVAWPRLGQAGTGGFRVRHSIWILGLVIAAAVPAPALAASTDWPQYLHGPQHASVSTATAITTANAASLHQLWRFTPAAVSGKPAPKLEASPTVVGARLYIGSEAGLFYAL